MRLTLSADVATSATRMPGFPYWNRATFEAFQSFGVDLESTAEPQRGNYRSLPITRIAVLQALVLKPEGGSVCVKLNGSDTEFFVSGALVLWLTTLDDGPSTNVLVRNPNPSAVHLRVLAAGIGIHESDAAPSGGEGFGDQGFGG